MVLSLERPETARRAAAVTRRRFLTVGGAAVALAFAPVPASQRAAAADGAELRSDPFSLGIASGDPLPDGVVLWTRLAPQPFDPMGGMRERTYPVDWQVAEDGAFRRVVRRGTATARPEYRHSVHVDVRGLRPDREYFYRFRAGSHLSPSGRTRTAPAPSAAPASLRFAFASCQAYPDGYYTAYRHMAAEDLDVVFFLGDYIYEVAVNRVGGNRFDTTLAVPEIFEVAPDTLDLYRLRYSLYKTDPDLQAAHAAFPWIVTWDDHEVQDNYAAAISKRNDPVDDFVVQRANAYRAFWEHQPLRRPQQPVGSDAALYRRFSFGDLADVSVLDTRQYRSDQACGDGHRAGCADRLDPARTMLGAAQRGWLLDGLTTSRARWNLLAQQVMMAQCRDDIGDPAPMDMDKWDGYAADRQRLLDAAAVPRAPGLAVLTGDLHINYAADLKRDFADADSPTVAVELVGTSISSGGNGSDDTVLLTQQRGANPHLRFANAQRGYVRCELTRDAIRADYRVLPYVDRPDAGIATRASFVSDRVRPGLLPA
jgi:alkaline phosphatase D